MIVKKNLHLNLALFLYKNYRYILRLYRRQVFCPVWNFGGPFLFGKRLLGNCLIFSWEILFFQFSLFLNPRNTRDNLAIKKGPFSKVLLKSGVCSLGCQMLCFIFSDMLYNILKPSYHLNGYILLHK